MERCKNFKNYKGLRAPTCNNGKPCKACVAKYNLKKGNI